jgi:hypothetical protein
LPGDVQLGIIQLKHTLATAEANLLLSILPGLHELWRSIPFVHLLQFTQYP